MRYTSNFLDCYNRWWAKILQARSKKIQFYMLKATFSLLSVLHFCVGCNTNIVHLPTISLKKEMVINQLSDSTYFVDIRSIDFCKGYYYITEYNRDNVFVLYSNLVLLNKFGIKGKGPGELLGASSIFVLNKDSIFVLNDGKKTIELFDGWAHQNTFTLPSITKIKSDLRFCVRQNYVYLSSTKTEGSITKHCLNNQISAQFGSLKEYKSVSETLTKNGRHLQLTDNVLIAVSDCQPLVELYSLDGVLLSQTNLDYIDVIRDNMAYIEKKNFDSNSYFQYFSDIYVYANKIYILTSTVNTNDKILSNHILQLDIINNQIIPVKIYNLGKGWYSSICISNKHILAYNRKTVELTLFNYE